MSSETDSIAAVVLAEFDRRPTKWKPAIRDNGCHEWVPLSGIVAKGPNGFLRCLSLATGMKCLPVSKLPPANGMILHDWHAEVLTIRSFNHFVLEECRKLALCEESEFLRRRGDDELDTSMEAWHGQPFAWRKDVTLHMYCSEAPCGDASMELTMAAQADASPWEIPPPQVGGQVFSGDAALPGRLYFSQLGVVRRKPARGDAPPTLSKSCSDKLALRQCTSLLSSLLCLFVSPENVYLESLILPASQYSPTGCARSFSAEGRMKALAGRHWQGGYSFAPFQVKTTSEEFGYSRRAVASRAQKTVASNLAVAWSCNGLEEGLIAGVFQGSRRHDNRRVSVVSRRKIWALAVDVSGLQAVGCAEVEGLLHAETYRDIKEDRILIPRQVVKAEVRSTSLKGWKRNVGDDSFSLTI